MICPMKKAERVNWLMLSMPLLIAVLACQHAKNHGNAPLGSNSVQAPVFLSDTCLWDSVYEMHDANSAILAWQKEWKKRDMENVPDSFYVSRETMESFVADYCGFHLYNGLKKKNNWSSLLIMIVPIDSFYHNHPRKKWLCAEGDQPSKGQFISRKKAEKFRERWIDLPDVPNDCNADERGKYPCNQAFSSQDFFSELRKVNADYQGIYFVCALKQANKEDPSTIEFDYFVKAYWEENGKGVTQAIGSHSLQSSETGGSLDLSCPCPGPRCCPY